MKFLSVCSGIEAASVAWHPLGWRAFALSEIERFPCAVLAHHYPDVPNLGDMTKFQEWPDAAIDVLVGGTPCQSFSVAGLRKGLADPRGNLTLTFLAIAERYKPAWIVWENVPGVISDKTGAFVAFLDGLEALGYIVDCDILDAQFHGVPQRRRRVFVCGQSRESLLSQRTDSSALTIAQCWQEILHGIFVEASRASGSAQESSGLAFLSRDGVERRMRLFGLHGDQCSYKSLRENLVEAFLRHQAEHESSDARLGEREKEPILADRLMGSPEESLYSLTAESLRSALDESYEVMKSFITSTPTSTTTAAEIYTCSKAALTIAKLILRLSQSSPCFWSAASSSLTALEAFTEYAGSTSSDLFGDVERVSAWRDFFREAEYTNDALVSIGIGCFGEVFPLADSLQGNPAPRREAREGTAGTITAGARKCDHAGSAAAGLIASTGNISHCLNAGGMVQQYYETETLIAHSLRADGFDASEDGTGRGTPLVPVAFDCKAVQTSGGKPGQGYPAARIGSAVRRLTPRECERLQGFPSIRELLRIDVCFDHQNGSADVALSCLRWPSNASRADAARFQPSAGSAAAALNISQASRDPLAALRARLGSEVEPLEIHSRGRLIWSASSAGTSSLYLPFTQAASIAVAAVGRSQCLALEVRAGRAESLQLIRLFIQGLSGDRSAPTFGDWSAGSASDAMNGARLARFTTSDLGQLVPNSASPTATSLCSVLAAISGCIPSETLPDSFSFEIDVEADYTAVSHRGKPAADGPRYKALGNSFAVPVVRWIGERIKAVNELEGLCTTAKDVA